MADLLLPPGLLPDAVRPLAEGREIRLGGETMGTGWSLAAVLPRGMEESVPAGVLERVFALVIGQMSQWEPGSDLSRFNRAVAGARVALPETFAHVLDCALAIARASDGAFDPTLGQASELWGFGAGAAPSRTPGGEEARETRRYCWRDVARSDGGRVLLQPGGLALDLSGIAKGFAVDLGIDALGRLGIGHALLEIGGELRGVGVRMDGMPWWVDLEVPPGSAAPTARIGLTGWAVATSGSYRRRREAGGRSWSHTLDPASGAPLESAVLSATVLHPGCMQADALASVLMVLGPERGIAFANANHLPARIVTPSATHTTTAWQTWSR